VNGATFTMTGGEISGNRSGYYGYGGGVYVLDSSYSIFRIVTGTIYGNNAGALSNTFYNNSSVGNGAALYKNNSGTAERGTLNGTTWTSTGSLTTTHNTIRVVNGVLQ
jgi:hypothetical protein